MAVAKRRGREKPVKIEQRKVWGPEWGPQVEETALLASPIYIGQAQGEEKHIKRGARGPGVSLPHALSLFLSLSPSTSRLLGQHALMPRGCIFLYFLNKTELEHRAVTLSKNCDTPRALTSVASNFCCDETEPRKLHTPLTVMYFAYFQLGSLSH